MATPPASVAFWMCTMLNLPPPTAAEIANTARQAPHRESSVLAIALNCCCSATLMMSPAGPGLKPVMRTLLSPPPLP